MGCQCFDTPFSLAQDARGTAASAADISDPIPYLGLADPVAAITHLLGALLFAPLGALLLHRTRRYPLLLTAASVYVLAVVMALAVSGIFHLTPHQTSAREVLVRLDHAAIFFLIAASYTPVHVVQFVGVRRWGVIIVVWAAGICGMVLKLTFYESVPEWISLLLYLGLGWAGAASAWMLYRRFGLVPLTPLFLGAIAYTLGAVLDFADVPTLIKGVIGPHEVFHVFVLAGIGCHWYYISRIVVRAAIHAGSYVQASNCG